MNNKEYLECLFSSNKPLIIYRVKNGFDVYTDFSKRIKLTKNNAKLFFEKTVKQKNSYNKFFDGYVGFLSYDDYSCIDVTTEVTFKRLNDTIINNYLEKQNPLDKAGSYAIQESIGLLGITKIKGSYTNVVGLPIPEVLNEIERLILWFIKIKIFNFEGWNLFLH